MELFVCMVNGIIHTAIRQKRYLNGARNNMEKSNETSALYKSKAFCPNCGMDWKAGNIKEDTERIQKDLYHKFLDLMEHGHKTVSVEVKIKYHEKR